MKKRLTDGQTLMLLLNKKVSYKTVLKNRETLVTLKVRAALILLSMQKSTPELTSPGVKGLAKMLDRFGLTLNPTATRFYILSGSATLRAEMEAVGGPKQYARKISRLEGAQTHRGGSFINHRGKHCVSFPVSYLLTH